MPGSRPARRQGLKHRVGNAMAKSLLCHVRRRLFKCEFQVLKAFQRALLAALAGSMAALLPIVPEPVVPVVPAAPDEFMEPEPVVPDEPIEPVAGLVEEGTGVTGVEVSAGLLQPDKASAATKASAAAVPVFNDEACMSSFL